MLIRLMKNTLYKDLKEGTVIVISLDKQKIKEIIDISGAFINLF